LQAEWSLQSMFLSHGVDRNQKNSRIERQVLRQVLPDRLYLPSQAIAIFSVHSCLGQFAAL